MKVFFLRGETRNHKLRQKYKFMSWREKKKREMTLKSIAAAYSKVKRIPQISNEDQLIAKR